MYPLLAADDGGGRVRIERRAGVTYGLQATKPHT